jgi:hypothetical protein
MARTSATAHSVIILFTLTTEYSVEEVMMNVNRELAKHVTMSSTSAAERQTNRAKTTYLESVGWTL